MKAIIPIIVKVVIAASCYLLIAFSWAASASQLDYNGKQYPDSVKTLSFAMDRDGDNVSDTVDAFPDDPEEWLDFDSDGMGNNSDEDDDNDGMPDWWEHDYGLNGFLDDADRDLDGDGLPNLKEFEDGSDPSQISGNSPPDQPTLDNPPDGALVNLTPTLRTGDFSDTDQDIHTRTVYQISTTDDFSNLVFQHISNRFLTSLSIFPLVLDPDTVYFWRAKFIDHHNNHSEWSEIRSFSTYGYAASGDANGDGIPAHQELDADVDLDDDGIPDINQENILGVKTSDVRNPYIAVKNMYAGTQIVGVQAIEFNQLSLEIDQPQEMLGLISFKLILEQNTNVATISVLFAEAAPDNANWYKCDTENGWVTYKNAQFSENRKSIIILLEDGGVGDQDGVRNGVIVDPSGMGVPTSLTSEDNSSAGFNPSPSEGATGCFIDSLLNRK